MIFGRFERFHSLDRLHPFLNRIARLQACEFTLPRFDPGVWIDVLGNLFEHRGLFRQVGVEPLPLRPKESARVRARNVLFTASVMMFVSRGVDRNSCDRLSIALMDFSRVANATFLVAICA